MMGSGPDMGIVELIEMFFFWGVVVTIAIWLLGLLFPIARSKKNYNSNSIKR